MSLVHLSPPPSLSEVADRRGMTEGQFPHANAGPRRLSRIKSYIITVVCLVAAGCVVRAGGMMLAELFARQQPGQMVGAVSLDVLFAQIVTIVLGIADIVFLAAGVFAFIALGGVVLYGVNVVQRQRAFERDVVKNDMDALALKKAILRHNSIPRQIREFRRRERKDRAQFHKSNNGGVYRRSLDQDIQLRSLQSVKRMEVFINTRESLGSQSVEKTSMIDIRLPMESSQNDKVRGLVSKYGLRANSITAASKRYTPTQFPESITLASTGSRAYFADTAVVDDKYAEPDGLTDTVVVDEFSPASSFPLTLFEDRTASVAAAQKEAMRVLTKMSTTVENLLQTNDIVAKTSTIVPSSKFGTLRMKMAQESSLKSVNQMADIIDRSLNTRGTTVRLDGSSILVTLVLPPSAQAPADTGLLFQEAFFS